MGRAHQLNRSVIQKIEGRITETHERLEHGGALIVRRPVDFVADTAGVSRSTVQRWLRDARKAERGRDHRPQAQLLRDFGASFDALCRASVSPIERSLIQIASDAKHPRCVDAARFMLPRLDPIGEGPQTEDPPERDPKIADVPQAVFDELSDDEIEDLERLAVAQKELEQRVTAVLRSAAERAGTGRDAVERLASAVSST